MNKYLVPYKDMYGIFERIKSIDPNYELMFDQRKKVFEIHDRSNKHESLCLTILPSNLDSRVLKKLSMSRREHMKDLFLEIERGNQKLQEEKIQKAASECSDYVSEIVDYQSRRAGELSSAEIRKIISVNQGEKNYA